MLTHEAAVELLPILDRFLANTVDEADKATLLRSLELLRAMLQPSAQKETNVNIGQIIGGDTQFGDRIYNQITNQIYNQTDLETLKQVLVEVLRSSSTDPSPPSLEEQREAVCQFLQWVEARFSSVEFLHRRGEMVVLKDQYIPIQVTLDKQPETSSLGRYLGYLESEAELQRAYALKKEDEQREQVDWQEAKKKHQRIMVLADPGMGKTTLLRMEAGTIAYQEQQALADGSKTLETVILPVWIRLSNLAEQVQQATDTVLEAILKLVRAEWDDKLFAKLQPLLEAKLRTGQCVLLLDALDEVPRTLRDRLSERLETFAGKYPCPIICTSRIVGYSSLLKGITQVEIVPFRQEQTRIYIEKWFTNAADTLDQTTIDKAVSAKNLIQELKSKPQVQGLAANPLLLSLVCSLYQEKGIALPARRCQVYTQAVEYMLLGRWNNRSRKPEGAKLQSKTRLLEYLAYQFTYEGVEIFSADQLYIKLGEYFSNTQTPTFKIFETEDPVEELTNEDGILQKLSEKEYLFFHRTFQEYFTASYLVRAGQEGIQLAKAHLWSFEWHETISLMAGLMAEPLDLIQEIVNEKDDIFHSQLLLAGRCMAECADSTNRLMMEVIGRTIDKIHQFWSHYPGIEFIRSVVVTIGKASLDKSSNFQKFLQHEDSKVRRSAVKALGTIGTPDVVPALIHVLQDEDIQVRMTAAYALGTIGTLDVVPALTHSLQDKDRYVKGCAVAALGTIGTPDVISALIHVLQDEDNEVKRYAAWALGTIDTAHPKVVLAKLLQSPGIAIDLLEIFQLIRQLAIRVSREGGDCVPVYPERVVSLIEKEDGRG